MSKNISDAREFLSGENLLFKDANQLWEQLKGENEISLARQVVEFIRDQKNLLDKLPAERKTKLRLCQQHAELTSKDPELSSSMRHDQALEILSDMFDLEDPALDGDAET